MPSTSVIPIEDRIDLWQSPEEVIFQITSQLLQGKYYYYSDWLDRIKNFIVSPGKSDYVKESIQRIVVQAHSLVEEENDQSPMQTAAALTLLGLIYCTGGLCGTPDYGKAVAFYQLAINLGNTRAMNNRALMHMEGKGGPINYTEAIRLFEQAIVLGDSQAMNNRAYLHAEGLGGPVNYPEAIRLLDQAISLGSISAINSRADYYYGEEAHDNYSETIRLLEQAIALGDSHAMSNRAQMHMFGEGGPVNHSEAIRLYEQARALGHTRGLINLALMYDNGQGCPVNYPEAIRLYEQAIFLEEEPTAMNCRAILHQHGKGGPVNYSEAIRLYEQAIALGNAYAMTNRASMHEEGKGGPVNYPEAIRLYEQAIILGSVEAKKRRGVMHMLGKGGPINFSAGISLSEQAIALNNNPSILNKFYDIFMNDIQANDAHQLLELLWEDLLAGKSFTPGTMTVLKTHCKGLILGKLSSSADSLTEQQKLTLGTKNNPLAQILGFSFVPMQNTTQETIITIAAFIKDYLNERLQTFTCPISQQLIREPLTYRINGCQFFFEREDFNRWRQVNNTCPNTRVNLFNVPITEYDQAVQQQISDLKQFLKDDGSFLTQEDIENQLKSEGAPIFFWIKSELIRAIELNDASRIMLFIKQLPICNALLSSNDRLICRENVESEHKAEPTNNTVRRGSKRVANLLLAGILANHEQKPEYSPGKPMP